MLDVADLVRHDGVEFTLVEALQKAAGQPHAGVAAVVAEREGVGHAVVHDAEPNQRDAGLLAAPGHDGPDGVVDGVPVAVGRQRDEGCGDEPLQQGRVDGVLQTDYQQGEDQRHPDRHAHGHQHATSDDEDRPQRHQGEQRSPQHVTRHVGPLLL